MVVRPFSNGMEFGIFDDFNIGDLTSLTELMIYIAENSKTYITDRIRSLVDDIPALESSLPMKRLGKVREIGNFVKSIVENDIKYMTGVTINFDGAKSNYLL